MSPASGSTRGAGGGAWEVSTLQTTVAAAHARPLEPTARRIVVVEPTDSAVVLASTQSVAVLDHSALAVAGLGVVRRRSGGGAVLVAPGEMVWLDVELPRDDPLWHDDVGHAVAWVGERCATALRATGAPEVTISRAMRHTDWSRLVCFAGLGPGEVTVAGRKVVGVAQRRTRAGARIQISVLTRWDPLGLAALFDLDRARRGELVGALRRTAGAVPVAHDTIRDATVEALQRA